MRRVALFVVEIIDEAVGFFPAFEVVGDADGVLPLDEARSAGDGGAPTEARYS